MLIKKSEQSYRLHEKVKIKSKRKLTCGIT